jgi:hypothetical protein
MTALRRGLLEACDDDRLLGLGLWPRQREVIAAVELHRLVVLALGRRSGKSTMAAATGLWDCLHRPELDDMVRPGETRYAVAVATNLAQARLIVSAGRSIVESSPALAGLVEKATEDEIAFRLPSGARTALRAFPCSSRSGRGWPISCLILDEFAHFLTETDGPAVADNVLKALLPATAQFGALGRVVIASTPYGPDGAFARMHKAAGEATDAVALTATTAEMNPTIDPDFLAMEELRDPLGFRSEYLAEFVAGGDAFIDLDRAQIGGTDVAPPEAGERWVAGIDPAFAARGDAFGVALVGQSRVTKGLLVVGPVLALRAEGEFTPTLEKVADIAAMYDAEVVTDQFSAASVLEFFRRRQLAVKQHAMSATSKTDVFSELRARLYEKTLELPNLPPLLTEVRRLQAQFRAGSAAVTNPRVGGSHGDMAQALALAVFEHRQRGGAQSVNCGPFADRAPTLSRGGLVLTGSRYMDLQPGGGLVVPAGWEVRR